MARIQASNDRIFNYLPENYILLTKELRITHATDQILDQLSMGRSSFEGHLFSEFVTLPKDSLQNITNDINHSLQIDIANKKWDARFHSFKGRDNSDEILLKLSLSPKNPTLEEDLRLVKKIADAFPGIIALYNVNTGEYLYMNESAKQITGYSSEELIQGGAALIGSFIHPDDIKETLKKNQYYTNKANNEYPNYKDDQVISFEYRIKVKDGSYKWFQTNGIIFKRDESNKVELILNFSFDITERKENELKIQQSEHELNIIKNELEKEVKEGKESVSKNELYFRFMADNIPGLIWTASPSGEMEYYNKNWEELTGINSEDAIKGDYVKAFHPDDLQASFLAVQNALTTGTEYKIKHRIKVKDGSYRWVISRAMPLKDKNNNIIKWFGTSFDIDDELKLLRELESSSTKYKFLADSIPQIIYTTTPDGEVDYMNKKWYEYTGLTPGNTDTNEIKQLIHEDEIEDFEKIYAHSMNTGTPFKVEFRLRNSAGEYHWFLGRAIPMKDSNGNIIKWFGSSTNIHDQKKIIEHLAQTKINLNQSNEELVKKNEELKRINADLDNFIYTASHDLKAPISNIEGLINLLKTNEYELNDDSRSVLNLMEISAGRFRKTIVGLTDVAKIQKNVIDDIEEVSFEEVYEEVIEDIKGSYDTTINIRTDFNVPTIRFSKSNLRSIIYNLLSNAIKFSYPKRIPEIDIATFNKEGKTIFTIHDNGLGIEKTNQEKAFKMFKRLHTHTEGTGIGLYIVKRIMDNTGGSIKIESEVNKGTKFTLQFKNFQ